MKIFLIILLFSLCSFAQSIDKITRRCPAPNGNTFASVSVINDILYSPCPARKSFFGGKIQLVDQNFVSPFGVDVTDYFNIGSNTRYTIPTANYFQGLQFYFPLSINGTNKNYTGQRQSLDVSGNVTNATIIGAWNTIASNALFGTGTTIYGNLTSVDIGTPVLEGYGAYFSVQSGGSGASGAGTLTGILANVGVAHNGNTAAAYAGDFWVNSSASTPSVVTDAAAVRARVRMNSGVNATKLYGLKLSDWINNGGDADASYGIYADTSIDTIAPSNKYFIYSLSNSPSRFAGDIAVSTTTKGLILKSPDGSCYRFTVANGGALSSGALTACP